MELRKRKKIRLQGYDYSQNGAYFVTICTQNRSNIFGGIIVRADDSVRPFPPMMKMTNIGQIVHDCWRKIDGKHDGITIDAFCVMPNHIHGIIVNDNTGGQSRPPLQKIVQSYKSITTRLCFPFGLQTLWQTSYHDHIIRNETDYLRICQYIADNLAKWSEDKYYHETKQ